MSQPTPPAWAPPPVPQPSRVPGSRTALAVTAAVATLLVVLLVAAGALWLLLHDQADLAPSDNATGEELTHLPLDEVDRLRTVRSDTPVVITFDNDSNAPVFVEWVDHDGEPHQYQKLPPGQHYQQESYATHPWLVRDKAGNPVVAVIAGGNPGTVTVQ